jgi:hypothetical protein
MSRLVSLYPRVWRDRYEAEFLGLIAERPMTLFERFDIVRGALDARLHPQVRQSREAAPSPPGRDDLRVARRLGLAAVIGAPFWLTAFAVMMMGPIRHDDYGAYRDGGAAFPIFFAAIVLLVAGLLGHLIRLPAGARLARGSAMAAIPFLLLFGTGPWMWPFGLISIVLLLVLAVSGLRAGAWPAGASLAVVASCIGVVMVVGIALAVAGGDRMAAGAFFVVAGVVLVPAWLGVGGALIRLPVLLDDTAR